MEAHVGAVVDSAMSTTSRQVGDNTDVLRRQQMKEIVLLVANVHPIHFFDVLVDKLDRAFEDFGRFCDLLSRRRRKAEQSEKIAGFPWL